MMNSDILMQSYYSGYRNSTFLRTWLVVEIITGDDIKQLQYVGQYIQSGEDG